MKFSLVAALVVVLVVSHGSEAKSLMKREVQADVERMTQLIRDMSASIAGATQDMVERVKAMELTNTAQTKIQPLVDKVQAEAARLQEQVKPFITNIEDQVKPMIADNFYTQVKPLTSMMENFLQQVMEQTKALLPPQ